MDKVDEIISAADEVNLSPSLAGECMTCALSWPLGVPRVRGVKDSKALTHKQRLALFAKIQERGAIFSVVPALIAQINEFGIYQARNIAMQVAIDHVDRLLLAKYGRKADKVLVDGPTKIIDDPRAEFIKDGDAKVYEISAASIVAKVYMDLLFAGYGSPQFWPGYNVENDHGAVSKQHKEALRERGPAPFHRTKNYGAEWWKAILGKRRYRNGRVVGR